MTTIILIDNYDSFTYNLYQYLGDLKIDTTVLRNDEATADEIMRHTPKGIIISPGPGKPNNAGVCLEIVNKCVQTTTPLLGICLGHQSIGQALGGNIIQTVPIHGKTSPITHNGKDIFQNIPSPLTITRYHSLIIDPKTCPADLTVTAQTADNIIMAVQHKSRPITGLQFHPESIATEHGHKLLQNFCEIL